MTGSSYGPVGRWRLRRRICRRCNGGGLVPAPGGQAWDCPRCGGTGLRRAKRRKGGR